MDIEIRDEDDVPVYRSGKLSLTLPKGEWKPEYTYDCRHLTRSADRTTGYIQDAEGNSYIREQLDLNVVENIYGLGERFTPFVKNGQTVDVWNEDEGTSSEQAYKNIPFFFTSSGYGVFVNDSGRVSFEIASEAVSRVQFSLPGEEMKY